MDCDSNCATCNLECDERDNSLKLNQESNVKKIIAVMSSKGGVGKSLVTSLLACALARSGLNVGILDADVGGPSIPHGFGIKDKAYGDGSYLFPSRSKKLKIDIISSNMFLEHDSDPILWRSNLVISLINQFYQDVRWEDKDVLLIDMPPGTNDVALSVFQTIPLDGIIMVTTPQEIVSMIVTKAIKMAEMMNIKNIGVIENMSYVVCPKCKEHIYIYGEHKNDSLYQEFNLEKILTLPLDPDLTSLIDQGRVEDYEKIDFSKVIDAINKLEPKEKKYAVQKKKN